MLRSMSRPGNRSLCRRTPQGVGRRGVLDLAFLGFLGAVLLLGLKRPFLWVLGYIYVDVLSPGKISWGFLQSIPVSLLFFVAAFGGWLLLDAKEGSRFTARQFLMLMLLLLCAYTTMFADFPEPAAAKWSWVWKSLVFAIFLPLTLRTRLRVEAAALVLVLAAGSILMSSGIKTLLSGGGYGSLSSYVQENSGIYEGSTLSTIAIAIIPLIIWLARYGTIFPSDWKTKYYAAGLVFAAVLTPIGLQTRTGLICLAVLAVLGLRDIKHRFLILSLMGAVVLAAVPFLPQSYTERMGTIQTHQADTSASTRVAVWMATLDYVKEHPMGGGFDAYLGNKLRYETRAVSNAGDVTTVERQVVTDEGRAYHSAYFEVLGEQGWLGLFIWLLIQGLGLIQLELVRRRLRKSENDLDRADASMANALQLAHVIYLVGALFVGIAYQPFIYMLIGLQIGLVLQVKRRTEASKETLRPKGRQPMQPVGMAGQS